MKTLAFALALMLLIITVPLQAQTVTDAQKAEIEKAVKGQITQYYGALDTLSAEASTQFWSRDKILGSLTATGLNSDLDSVLKGLKNTFSNRKAQKSDISDIKVIVPSPDTAIAIAKGTYRIEYRNGNISNGNWASTTIWVKEPAGWKMAHIVQNSAAI